MESIKKNMSQYMYDLMFGNFYVKESDDTCMIIESKKDNVWTHDISRFTITLIDGGINIKYYGYTVDLEKQEDTVTMTMNNNFTVSQDTIPLFIKNFICTYQ